MSLDNLPKGTYYFGIKVFNSLPTQIKDLSYNIILFKLPLKSYLYFHSYYTLEEYLIIIRIKTLNSDMQLCMHISINQLDNDIYLFLSNKSFMVIWAQSN